NEWSAAGQLTHAVYSAACVTYKDSIYVFGGIDEDDKKAIHVQQYNTVTQLCTLAAVPIPRAQRLMRAVLWETSAILLGRYTSYIYSFKKQTWQERKQFQTDVFHFGLVLDNQTLYIA